MKINDGVKLLEEIEGNGKSAQKGDYVLFNLKIFLNQGDEVLLNEAQAKEIPSERIREENGRILIDRTVILGKRQVIAGVEKGLIGMKVGGYRKIKVSPHLAYREKGIANLIPANAVLVIELWLRSFVGNQ